MERSLALSIIYQRRTLLAVSSSGLSMSYCLDGSIFKIVDASSSQVCEDSMEQIHPWFAWSNPRQAICGPTGGNINNDFSYHDVDQYIVII